MGITVPPDLVFLFLWVSLRFSQSLEGPVVSITILTFYCTRGKYQAHKYLFFVSWPLVGCSEWRNWLSTLGYPYEMARRGKSQDGSTFQIQSLTFYWPKWIQMDRILKIYHSFKCWPNSLSVLWPCLAKVGLTRENLEVPLRSDISISVQKKRSSSECLLKSATGCSLPLSFQLENSKARELWW